MVKLLLADVGTGEMDLGPVKTPPFPGIRTMRFLNFIINGMQIKTVCEKTRELGRRSPYLNLHMVAAGEEIRQSNLDILNFPPRACIHFFHLKYP